MEKTDAEITILVCGSSSYYSAVAVSETDTTTDADVVTAVSGSSYYFSAAADLVMDADVATAVATADAAASYETQILFVQTDQRRGK